MITINPFIKAQTTEKPSAAKRKSGVSNTGLFGEMLDGAESASEAAHVAEAAPVATLNPMLGLQEISDEEVVLRQAVKRGRLTLDVLDDLRHALLMGSVPPHLLGQIDKLVQEQRQTITDPQLTEILDDIELRAAVELAKLQMARQRRS